MQESTKAEQMEQGDKSKDFPESGEREWSQRILKDSTWIIIEIEQSVEMRSRLYMLFMDFQVAFDSLDREKIINVIKELYSGFLSVTFYTTAN